MNGIQFKYIIANNTNYKPKILKIFLSNNWWPDINLHQKNTTNNLIGM